MPDAVTTPTLYLTRITLDDRHPRILRAIGDLSEIHRLVYSGFRNDLPQNDGENVPRILYRLETPHLFIQSPERPHYKVGDGIIDADIRPFAPQLSPGELLAFRIRATPTRRTHYPDSPVRVQASENGKRPAGESKGKRVAVVGEANQEAWLKAQFEGDTHRPGIGAKLISCRINGATKPTGVRVSEDRHHRTMTHSAVDFDGLLSVSDPTIFIAAVARGIGAGKAWGFGLLSVRRAK